MTTLQEQWKIYRDAVYRNGMTADQNREAHAAFFAGALTTLKLAIEDTSELAPEDAQKQILALITEAKATCQSRFCGELSH